MKLYCNRLQFSVENMIEFKNVSKTFKNINALHVL